MPARVEPRPEGLEPWAPAAFAVGIATLLLYLYLGLEPGGSGPVIAYRWGTLVLAALAALGLFLALGWCLLRRPVMQRERWKPMLVLAASLWGASYPFPYPSSHAGHPSDALLRNPLAGETTVVFSGEDPSRDPLSLDPARRFGVLLESAPGRASVLAPVAGTVVARELVRGLESLGIGGMRLVLALPRGELLVLEGLDPAGLAESGAELAAGQGIGRLADQRLLLFLIDRPELERAEGIPMRFAQAAPRAGEPPGRALEQGQTLEPGHGERSGD